MFFPLLTALVMLGFGVGVLWLNARRPTNQALAVICFLSVLVFAAQLVAKHLGAQYLVDRSTNPLPWIRLKFALIGLLSPLMVWVCYYLVSGRYSSRRNLILKLLPWIALSIFLFAFPFTEGFKPNTSLPGNIQYGPLYLLYFGPMLLGQIAVCASSMVVAKKLQGVRKLEFTFITIALGYLSLAAVLAETIYATWPKIPGVLELTRLLSYSVYLVFGVSAWSVASRRVYHTGQVLLSVLERALLLTVVCVPTIFAIRLLGTYEKSPFAAATVLAGAILLLAFCDDKVRGWLRLKSEQQTSAVVRDLHALAASEGDPERLADGFERILAGFAHCGGVRIFQRDANHYAAGGLLLAIPMLRDAMLLSQGWVSVVSLARAPTCASNPHLQSIMEKERLPVLVCPRWARQEPALIIGFGQRENDLPYTHPEIRLMRELADVVEALHTRARLTLQARQSEQLATIGRLGVSIMHELKNPMWILRSSSELLLEKIGDEKYLREFAETVPKEAERIETLAQQLLDLSKPRKYTLARADLHKVIDDAVVLCRAQVNGTPIHIAKQFSATRAEALVDTSAIQQVLLNLLRNASEAVIANPGERRIEIRTRDAADGLCLEVEDNGPGIPRAIRGKLFEPFASAGKQGGIGLGLAISQEIVKVHGGTIGADLERERGCLFRITLPLAG